MRNRIVEIPTPDGAMDTFITHPEEGGPFLAVVVFMDIWGVREELFEIARRIGTVGYYCMVPDLYHRQGGIRYEYRDADNRMISLNRLDEARFNEILATRGGLTGAMIVEDTGALIDFIDDGEPASTDAMGSVGYCMGGQYVLLAAANYPDRFKASASLHGTNLVTDEDDSTHLLAPKFRGELYCGFGANDPYTPPQVIDALEDALGGEPVGYRCEIHPNADHGYALPDRDVFDLHAAARDWELIFAMFRRQLPLGDA